jgi:hypothetical protein
MQWDDHLEPKQGRAEGAERRDCNKVSRIRCPSAGKASTRLRVACSGCLALESAIATAEPLLYLRLWLF